MMVIGRKMGRGWMEVINLMAENFQCKNLVGMKLITNGIHTLKHYHLVEIVDI